MASDDVAGSMFARCFIPGPTAVGIIGMCSMEGSRGSGSCTRPLFISTSAVLRDFVTETTRLIPQKMLRMSGKVDECQALPGL